MKKFLFLFFAVNLVLSAFFIDTWLTPNPGSRAIPMITLFEEKTLKIDRYHHYTLDKSLVDGHYYSDKAPLATFITLPFYGLTRLFDLDRLAPDTYPAYSRAYTHNNAPVDTDSFVFPAFWAYATGGLVCGSLPFAIILLITFLAVRRGGGPASPVWLVCLPFYGSFVFVYTGAFFGHLPAALFLLLSCILLKKEKHHFYAGLLLGAAFLSEYTVGLALPLWAALILVKEKSWKTMSLFAAGFLPGLLLNFLYVFLITGSPFSMPYSHVSYEGFAPMRENLGFGLPDLHALAHLLITPYRGLLFYAPFLALALIAATARRPDRNFLKAAALDYTVLFSFCFVLLISAYYMWDGGYACGPRHLIPVAVLLTYEGIVFFTRKGMAWRPLFYSVTGLGLVMAWAAKSTVAFLADPAVSNPFSAIIIPEFTAGRFNPNALPAMLFGLPPVVGIIAWPILFFVAMAGLNRLYETHFHSQ